MAVFILLQQIYLHNKKEQQSAEIIKGSQLWVKGKSAPEELKDNVGMIKYKHLEVKQKQTKKTWKALFVVH